MFRAASDLVTVPVSVRASGMNVAGLRADDFVVTDNGVRQTIESLQGEAVPADVTILVETSAAMADYLVTIDEQLRKIVAMLRPTDRFEVLGIGTYVNVLMPLRPASERREIPRLKVGGLASVNDGLVAALLREPDRERPHLVIALTDTIDTLSAASMETVRTAARFSEATLVIAWVTLSIDACPQGDPFCVPAWSTSAENLKRHIRNGANRTEPRTRAWYPHYDPPEHRVLAAFDPVKSAAEMTGGALHPPGVFVDRTAAAIFQKLYADFRASYVLKYSASGVVREGWHDITVTIPRVPSAEIHAKRGYFVEK